MTVSLTFLCIFLGIVWIDTSLNGRKERYLSFLPNFQSSRYH